MARWRSVAIENLFDIQERVEHRFRHSCLRGDAPLIEGGDLYGFGAARVLMLLFAGTASTAVRTIGFPPRLLSVDEFVFGVPGIWSGMIGPATRERHPSGEARVVAEIEIGGRLVVAERIWTFDGPEFAETIQVDGSDFPSDGDAEARLAQLLPAAAVPLILMTGGAVRDMCDHPGRSRSALDFLSRKPFLEALLRTLDGLGSSDGPSRASTVAGPASTSCWRGDDAQASQTNHRERILRDLRSTTQELERLADALGFEFHTATPHDSLPDRLVRWHRAWLDRAKPPALPDRDATVLDDLGRTPEASVARGTGWAELRFIEVQASLGRLKHRLSEFLAANGTDSPPTEPAGSVAEDMIDERPANERLIDCIREFAECVRARRAY